MYFAAPDINLCQIGDHDTTDEQVADRLGYTLVSQAVVEAEDAALHATIKPLSPERNSYLANLAINDIP